MKLPNGDRAQIDVAGKLVGYCLNPAHSKGKFKAIVFESVLGVTASHALLLADALAAAAREGDARIKEKSTDAVKYEIECPMTGPAGSAIVRSGWIIEKGTDVPRLVTCYVRPPQRKRGKRGKGRS